MKKLVTLYLFFVACTALSAQLPGTWTDLGSGITADNRSMQGISVVDSLTVWGITYDVTDATFASEFTRTTDGGQTWTSASLADSGPVFFMSQIFALNKDTAWIAGYTNSNGQLRKTTDGGATWTAQTGSFSDPGVFLAFVHFFDANEGVAYGGPLSKLKIWTTLDGGLTWDEVPEDSLPFLPAPHNTVEGIRIHYGNGHYAAVGDTLWFGTNNLRRIWRSADRGKTWRSFNWSDRNLGSSIWSVAFKDARNGIGVSSTEAFQTFDGGETWHRMTGLPVTLITYYQIEHIPGTNGCYYLTYEGSNQFYNDIRHAYSLDNGKTWVQMGSSDIECLKFFSPSRAWGGGQVTSDTSGGMYVWSGQFPTLSTPDHAAVGRSQKLSPYTMLTQRQVRLLQWKHRLTNTGELPLTNITATMNVQREGNQEMFQETIAVLLPGESHDLSFDYMPQEIGVYVFSLTASNAELGDAFYTSPVQTFEVSNDVMAKDDGTTETQLGFGFGNPNWYGYYGSAFELIAQDTITAISVQINRSSNFSGGSIHLRVSGFDSLGIPTIELYHSDRIQLSDFSLSSSNNLLNYPLSTPLILPSGRYLLAAGQDELQGVVGFDFDLDNVSEEGFWLAGPLAFNQNWRNPIYREAMLIRPQFNPETTTTVKEIPTITTHFKVYPNPFTDRTLLEFELKNATQPVHISVTDVLGRQLHTWRLNTPNVGLNQLPVEIDAPGGSLLFITLRQGQGYATLRVVKE